MADTDPKIPNIIAKPNGFFHALALAYNQHHHLLIKPDDVWVSITTSLSRYIDANAERLRHIFVAHEGKKELVVYGGGSILSADYNTVKF